MQPTSAIHNYVTGGHLPWVKAGADLGHTLRTYNVRSLRGDLMAGLTVAVVDLPQAIAYAFIAGVPPQYGIYTSIVQGFLAALFASNAHLATGPTNTHSLLIAATVSQIVAPEGDAQLYLQLVIGLTLVKGLIQLLFAAARMGNLIRYVSRSVIIGFAAGAGILIAAGQVPAFLGFSPERSEWPGLIGIIHGWLPHLMAIDLRSVGIGVAALAVILAARAWSPLAPGPLAAIVLAGLVVWATGWAGDVVRVVGELPRGLPGFEVPWLTFAQAEALLIGAVAIALLGMIETVSIGKSVRRRDEQPIDANQEFFAQGMASVAGSFFQTIPGSGSFSRTALNVMAGGQTRLASVYNAVIVAIIFLLLAPVARYIPMPALAAILFVVAWSLVDWRSIRHTVRASRSDGAVCLITLLATLVLPLAYAIYVGIFLNIALYLRRASQLHIAEMVRTPGGPFLERPIRDRTTGQRSVIFLQLEGDLFFAVADELNDALTRVARSPVRVAILRLKRTHSLDATVETVLERFVEEMQAKGGHVLLCGLKPELIDRLRRFGLLQKIGQENVFEAGYGVFTSAKRALKRARDLVGSSLDAEGIGEIDEVEGWAYEI